MSQPPLDYQTPSPHPSNPLQAPAICLLASGTLTLAMIALDFLSRLINSPSLHFTYGIHIGPPESSIAFNLLSLILTPIMMLGSIRMLQLRHYDLAHTAAIIALIPCTATCCCIFTLPFGLWALILLNKPEIKASFHEPPGTRSVSAGQELSPPPTPDPRAGDKKILP